MGETQPKFPPHHHHHHHHLHHHHHHHHLLHHHPYIHTHHHFCLLPSHQSLVLCPCQPLPCFHFIHHHHAPSHIPVRHFPLNSDSSSINLAGHNPAPVPISGLYLHPTTSHRSPEGGDNIRVSENRDAVSCTPGFQHQYYTDEVDLEEEEEEEDVFVLTDEWMEFFAKSEAKRRMDKQQKHRKGGK